jgi:16S rRNA (cytidine1402-2'-O)-methyltransferase
VTDKKTKARVAAMGTTAPHRPRQAGQDERDHTGRDDGVVRSFMIADQPIQGSRLAPGLYLVATPIGNLGDVTLRALQALAGADLIACEDTRVTRKLLDRYAIATPLTPYHEHNAAQARPALLRRLAEGAAVALVSDAGTPLISDPGFKLVRAAQEAGHLVTALPGASAVLTALTVAGLPTDRFFFAGFLPPKAAARRARIAELAQLPATLVLFETGPRIAASLADLADGLGADREAALCRELTKLHEEIKRGVLANLAATCAGDELRGEIVVVIAPPQEPAEMGAAESEGLLRQALERLSLKDAVAEVAELTGRRRREIYQSALALQKAAKKDAKHGAPR